MVQIGSRTLKTLLRHHENIPDVCKYTTATVKDETKQFSKIIYKQICL